MSEWNGPPDIDVVAVAFVGCATLRPLGLYRLLECYYYCYSYDWCFVEAFHEIVTQLCAGRDVGVVVNILHKILALGGVMKDRKLSFVHGIVIVIVIVVVIVYVIVIVIVTAMSVALVIVIVNSMMMMMMTMILT